MDNSVEVYQDGNSSAHESPQQSPVSDGVTVKAEDITGIAGVGGSTKLFVGQVPKAMMENELSSMFSPFGRVLDTSVLRDRLSGESKGCAFVTYATQHEADVAIASLHNMKILPVRAMMVHTIDFFRVQETHYKSDTQTLTPFQRQNVS